MDMESALAQIDLAADRSFEVGGVDAATIEALRYLRDQGVERATLVWFWESLRGDNEIGRSQNANACRNRIKWQVEILLSRHEQPKKPR